MPSAKPPRTPARSQASKFCGSSTSPPPRRSPTACTKNSAAKLPSTISAAVLSTFPFSSSFPPPTAISFRFFPPHGELAQELRKALIDVKHRLSEAESATLRFPLPNGDVFTHDFTRGALDALIRPVVDRTMGPVKQALADAQLKPADMDEIVLVGGTTRTPLIRRTVQEFFGRKPHIELNPDEVVALGAAVQANILDRGVKNMLLLDVTPLSLGIETYGGAVAKIIPRNSTIPASAQELYTTGVDNQTGIDIHVLQGERELAKDCRSLARFSLRVPPAPAGLPRIEVKFLIDANGIL